jgi:hypothetical protein
MFHVIPSDLLQSILSYLDTRPHREVRGLIDGVMKDAKESPAATASEADPKAPE